MESRLIAVALAAGALPGVVLGTARDVATSGPPLWTYAVSGFSGLVGVLIGTIAVYLSNRGRLEFDAVKFRSEYQAANEKLSNDIANRMDDRTASLELDHWRRRQATLDVLRWGVDLCHFEGKTVQAVSKRTTGIKALEMLCLSELLQPEDEELVWTVYETVLAAPSQGNP